MRHQIFMTCEFIILSPIVFDVSVWKRWRVVAYLYWNMKQLKMVAQVRG